MGTDQKIAALILLLMTGCGKLEKLTAPPQPKLASPGYAILQTDFFIAKESIISYRSANKSVDYRAANMTLLIVLDTVPINSTITFQMDSRAHYNEMVCKVVNESSKTVLYHDSSYSHILQKQILVK